MTTEEQQQNATPTDPKKYFHLHDGNGQVIHGHKPGMNLRTFFVSLGMDMDQLCTPNPGSGCIRKRAPLRLFINGVEQPYDAGYVFNDIDQILITDATGQEEIDRQLQALTDDACLYSRTCPERGEPPVENCIADPTVPCVVQ